MKLGKRVRQEDEEEVEAVSPHKKSKKTKRRSTSKERDVAELPHHQDDEERENTFAEPGEEDTEGTELSPDKILRKKKKKKKQKMCETLETPKDDVKVCSGSLEDPTSLPNNTDILTGRHYTVSIALPGSIIDNAQTPELKTYLAGQIARTAAVFCIDEIIIFDEQGKPSTSQAHNSNPNVFLAKLLQYQETPQYLRKMLFPMHPDLKYVGLLNPLDSPHHMRMDDVCQYREGIVTESVDKDGSRKMRNGSLVNCGMRKKVMIDKVLEAGTRVTVKLQTAQTEQGRAGGSKIPRGEAVAPSVPRTQGGLYWGYTVRLASSFSAVFTDGPHQGGYDLTIGTSERGESVDNFTSLPAFHHLLIVFGGLKGLEYALECDDTLQVKEVSRLFHHYLNTCPNQGSRTIRTEEAMLISLSSLRPLICKNKVQSTLKI